MLPKDMLPDWKGFYGDSDLAFNSNDSDYDRACGIDGLIGVIDVGKGIGIVLGDEPAQTAWIPKQSPLIGMLVRWIFAENEEKVMSHLDSLTISDAHVSSIDLCFNYSAWLLFDAGFPGLEVPNRRFLEIQIPLGAYNIKSVYFKPDTKTCLLLHLFVKNDALN